jgi:hypothetical protein
MGKMLRAKLSYPLTPGLEEILIRKERRRLSEASRDIKRLGRKLFIVDKNHNRVQLLHTLAYIPTIQLPVSIILPMAWLNILTIRL